MSNRGFYRILAVTVGLLACNAFGDDQVGKKADVDPRADEILRQMSACLAAADEFTFEAYDMLDEVLASGHKLQWSAMRRFAVHRPNKAYANVVGDLDNQRVWYDSGTLTLLLTDENVYGVLETPQRIDAMLDYAAEEFGVVLPLADLLFSNPYDAVIGQVEAGQYVGLHNVYQVKCHHLAFQQAAVDWQVWIDAGDQPLPHKLVITYKTLPGQPQYIALLRNWDLKPRIPEGLFTAQVPADAVKKDFEPIRTGGRTKMRPVEESPPPGDEQR